MESIEIQNRDGYLHSLVIRSYYPDIDGMHVGYAVSKPLVVVLFVGIVLLLIPLSLFLFGHMAFGIGAVLLIPMLILSNLTYHQIKIVGKALSPVLIFVDSVFLITMIPLIAAGKVTGVDVVLLLLTLLIWSIPYHEIKMYSGYYELNKQGRPIRFLASTFFIDQRPTNRSRFLRDIQ